MQFKEDNHFVYTLYSVRIEYNITHGCCMSRSEEGFRNLQEAINYIKKLKKDIKADPSKYGKHNIILIRTKKVIDNFLVLDGD